MERLSYAKAAPGVYRTMLGMHEYLKHCGVDQDLLELVYLRASQINGCAFCIDMHWKNLCADGVGDQKLYMLNAWREWPEYSDRERAALEWTEAVTRLRDAEVSDAAYEQARAHFSEAELANLTLAVCAINSWNRLNVAFRTKAGTYQPVRAGS